MIQDHKIIAFTPVGRKRYMDLLAAHVKREHERGHIDEWILFNNAYVKDDSTYVDQLAAHWDWVTVLREHPLSGHDTAGGQFTWRRPDRIADFYKYMTQAEGVIYFRLDDDIVYIDENCVPNLVEYRLANPNPFLVFPTIINNVRTSYHMQQAGIVPATWGIKDNMCDEVAWKHPDYVFTLHQKALGAIEQGILVQEFKLPSEQFTDWEAGHISINSFAIFGRDMLACKVAPDEEGYLSLWRPKELNRQNARAGDAIVIHFAYHTQTEFMDKSGMLNDYVKLAPPLGFRTSRLAPEKEVAAQPPPPVRRPPLPAPGRPVHPRPQRPSLPSWQRMPPR